MDGSNLQAILLQENRLINSLNTFKSDPHRRSFNTDSLHKDYTKSNDIDIITKNYKNVSILITKNKTKKISGCPLQLHKDKLFKQNLLFDYENQNYYTKDNVIKPIEYSKTNFIINFRIFNA